MFFEDLWDNTKNFAKKYVKTGANALACTALIGITLRAATLNADLLLKGPDDLPTEKVGPVGAHLLSVMQSEASAGSSVLDLIDTSALSGLSYVVKR